MNRDLRARLLKLIEELKLPMPPEEAKEHVEKLSDEEVELLVSTYEDVKKNQDAIDKALRKADPKKYAELEKEYKERIKKIDKEYSHDMEKIQEEEDIALDAIEVEASRKVDEEVRNLEFEVSETEKMHDDLNSKLKSALGENQASS